MLAQARSIARAATLLAGAALIGDAASIGSARAAETVKIGFIATLSGPGGGLGQDLLDGFTLGIKNSGGTLGGAAPELIVGDDQAKPDIGRQVADKMVERDRVDIVTGIVFSNVMLALAKPVLDSGTFLISANAGPSELAGKQCNPNFFAASWQNDTTHEAMGAYAETQGYKRVYLLAPNYPAGKDALAGFKRLYKGEILAEVYTQFGQLDYAAELAQLRAAKPDAVYFFYPGGMGINFIKQYSQAGLTRDIPILGPSFSLDQTILPAVGDAALGARASTFWSEKLANPANATFVADFEATYKRIPSPYAAQAYDAARLIDSALKATGGSVKNKATFRSALLAANFDSVRGPFKFNTNHFPIQNYYVTEIVKDDKGRPVMDLRGVVLSNHPDAYVGECKMKAGL
jgi:branched-chain amino acid transport system substrate-binding protein